MSFSLDGANEVDFKTFLTFKVGNAPKNTFQRLLALECSVGHFFILGGQRQQCHGYIRGVAEMAQKVIEGDNHT